MRVVRQLGDRHQQLRDRGQAPSQGRRLGACGAARQEGGLRAPHHGHHPHDRARHRIPSQSAGYAAGLHTTEDPLFLRSGAALVLDQDTKKSSTAKNSEAVLPIASLSKLMTALVISEAKQPLDETLEDHERRHRHREEHAFAPGSRHATVARRDAAPRADVVGKPRRQRARSQLSGELAAFIPAMNAKAKELGMLDTHYVEPTGLSSQNKSSARDLAVLVNAAHQVPLLREYSTTPSLDVELGRRQVQFHTTDRLVANPTWDIGLQKTGFINEAGQCLVMQAQMAGRKLIMVLLDSAGKYSRIADAERIAHVGHDQPHRRRAPPRRCRTGRGRASLEHA